MLLNIERITAANGKLFLYTRPEINSANTCRPQYGHSVAIGRAYRIENEFKQYKVHHYNNLKKFPELVPV